MEEKNCLGVNIVVREEKQDGKTVIIVNNEESGIADFGDTVEEAIENFRKSLKLYFEAYPEKTKIYLYTPDIDSFTCIVNISLFCN